MTGNFAVLPDGRILLNLNKRAYLRSIADFAPVEIDKFGQLHISSELHIRTMHKYESVILLPALGSICSCETI